MKPADLLNFALEKHSGAVAVCDVRDYCLDSVRGRDGGPGKLTAQMPDNIVQSLRGPADKAGFRLLYVAIPRRVEERASSRIVLLGEH